MRLPFGYSAAVALALVAGVALGWSLWPPRSALRNSTDLQTNGRGSTAIETPAERDANELEIGGTTQQTQAFCGACHALPAPGTFPAAAWRKEVEQGYEFYRESQRTDLIAPPVDKVVAWFQSRAPERLLPPDVPADDDVPALEFRREDISLDGFSELPVISHVHRLRLGTDALVLCDMRSGEVGSFRLDDENRRTTVLARLTNPCHVESCDLDQNGDPDLVVADLGSFSPADHGRGRVVWLRRASADVAEWKVHVLQARLGRVADVQPGDFDGDGDTDLLVAEFGWRKTGRILMLENTGSQPDGIPKFDLRVVDSRHGAIHVPVIDLNGDGLLDFVALISQEHEVIEAFLNTGHGEFCRETIHAAGNPSFGSTGIQLVDLDGDGDTDVLYTNGDAMDSFLVKPYHGVQWLENTGSYPFTYHSLAALPGAARAEAADLDGDGRLDVVAVAYLPDHVLAQYPDTTFDSIIWLAQDRPREFTRHRVERGNLQHMSVALADGDGDGSIDLWVGNFSGSPDRAGPHLSLWRNRGPGRPKKQESETGNCGSKPAIRANEPVEVPYLLPQRLGGD
jgi:hypothetical protein